MTSGQSGIGWSVFAKPWAQLPAAGLAEVASGLGCDGVELPVRPGCTVTPENARATLPGFAATLQESGVGIVSVASELSEPVFAACAEAGVAMVRVMAPVDSSGHQASVRRFRQRLEQALPLVERYGVGIGVQSHRGPYVTTAIGVHGLLEGLPPSYSVIWDAAHEALAGQEPTVTLDAVADRLSLVNLKNATYRPLPADEESPLAVTRWRPWFVAGNRGLSDWQVVIEHLVRRGWTGSLCLSAQYDEVPDSVAAAAARDISFGKSLLATASVGATSSTKQGKG